MEQRFCVGGQIEIARLTPEQKVGDETRTRNCVQRKALKLIIQKRKPAEHQCRQNHDDQCREYALNSPGIEISDAERASRKIIDQDFGDQIAGDDKEYVDTDKPASHGARQRVIKHHGRNGQGPQTVNLWTIFHGWPVPVLIRLQDY